MTQTPYKRKKKGSGADTRAGHRDTASTVSGPSSDAIQGEREEDPGIDDEGAGCHP